MNFIVFIGIVISGFTYGLWLRGLSDKITTLFIGVLFFIAFFLGGKYL